MEGHIFVNPVDTTAYMALLWYGLVPQTPNPFTIILFLHLSLHAIASSYKNGSLTRERIRDQASAGSWEEFSSKLLATPPGNNGNIGKSLSLHCML